MGIEIAAPTEMATRTYDRVADLPGETWDTLLTADDFYLSTPWLDVVESTAAVSMRYILGHRGDSATAALATALLDRAAPWTLGRPDTLLAYCAEEGFDGAAALRDSLPGALADALLPSLVCGGRHLGRTRIGLSTTATDSDLRTMLDAAEEIAGDRSARSLCFLYVDERDRGLRALLHARGYAAHVSAYYCWLSLPGGGFDGYADVLSSHRRARVLAERRRLHAAGVEVRVEPFDPGLIDRMADLETRLFAKYGMTDWAPERSERFLRRVHEVLGDRAVLSVARADGEVRGFGLLLRFGDQWFVHRTGFDYEYQGKLPLYYEVNYYRPVEVAESFGISAIHYGIGSTEAKRSRGCAAAAQYSYLRRLES